MLSTLAYRGNRSFVSVAPLFGWNHSVSAVAQCLCP